MISLERNFKYRLFGLNIQSELELPELLISYFSIPDITIRIDEVSDELPDYTSKGVLYRAKPGVFLFKLDTVGKYLVEDGRKITIERLNNSSDEEIRLFLLGSAFGALLHQRRLLPFHGSTVVKKGKAFILSGYSGAGKSSLAAVLVNRGYSLLADDISVIDFRNGEAVIHPGIPHLKLWEDVLVKLEKQINYQRVRPQLQKYRKPVDSAISEEPVAAGSIVVLSSKNSEGFEKEKLTGIKKFTVLKSHTYRFQFVEGLGIARDHFRMIGKLATSVPVWQVKRPSSPLLLDELADYAEGELEFGN